MDRLRRRLSWAALVALAAVLAAAATSATAGGRDRPKPDLVISDASSGGSRFTFQGETFTLTVDYVTKNKERARAGRSRSGIYLDPQFAGRRAKRIELLARHIPKLGPGDSDHDHGSFDFSSEDLPLGAYDVEICADARHDVKEEREGNNCRSTGKQFYVIREDWGAAVNGEGAVAGAPHGEQWHSSGPAHLSFAKYLGDGAFRYDFSAVVQWTDSGTNSGGCTLTGSGTEQVDETNAGPGIVLSYGRANYKGTVALNSRFYTIFSTGFSYCQNFQGPAAVDLLQIPRRDLRFNQTELSGKLSEPGVEGTTWNWSFH